MDSPLQDIWFAFRSLMGRRFVGVAGALLGAAVVATILPARRATRIDPIDALRSE